MVDVSILRIIASMPRVTFTLPFPGSRKGNESLDISSTTPCATPEHLKISPDVSAFAEHASLGDGNFSSGMTGLTLVTENTSNVPVNDVDDFPKSFPIPVQRSSRSTLTFLGFNTVYRTTTVCQRAETSDLYITLPTFRRSLGEYASRMSFLDATSGQISLSDGTSSDISVLLTPKEENNFSVFTKHDKHRLRFIWLESIIPPISDGDVSSALPLPPRSEPTTTVLTENATMPMIHDPTAIRSLDPGNDEEDSYPWMHGEYDLSEFTVRDIAMAAQVSWLVDCEASSTPPPPVVHPSAEKETIHTPANFITSTRTSTKIHWYSDEWTLHTLKEFPEMFEYWRSEYHPLIASHVVSLAFDEKNPRKALEDMKSFCSLIQKNDPIGNPTEVIESIAKHLHDLCMEHFCSVIGSGSAREVFKQRSSDICAILDFIVTLDSLPGGITRVKKAVRMIVDHIFGIRDEDGSFDAATLARCVVHKFLSLASDTSAGKPRSYVSASVYTKLRYRIPRAIEEAIRQEHDNLYYSLSFISDFVFLLRTGGKVSMRQVLALNEFGQLLEGQSLSTEDPTKDRDILSDRRKAFAAYVLFMISPEDKEECYFCSEYQQKPVSICACKAFGEVCREEVMKVKQTVTKTVCTSEVEACFMTLCGFAADISEDIALDEQSDNVDFFADDEALDHSEQE
ncbi:hypothetical protein M422DRAFT_30270 [Sphaerobolus stellatus SS14]|uniref:Uncharacterized protein n=1 Tax=Sphaerobolus stellatus (strain SS14) TaxID=990650 RepID=A0A0C9UPI1_SPHS4|nr:hypothetical protein M422DRAFT_30270 [Sphaerobolus stellatus SS14]